MGIGSGVVCWEGDYFICIVLVLLGGKSVFCFICELDGMVWVGIEGGLFWIGVDDVVIFVLWMLSVDVCVVSVIYDCNGGYWLGMVDGLYWGNDCVLCLLVGDVGSGFLMVCSGVLDLL